MDADYTKLYKLLLDKKMKRGELAKKACIAGSTLAKLGRGASVNVSVLIKICRVLNCTLDDIMEILPAQSDQPNAGGRKVHRRPKC
jgi:DNA-binding Xre family transcriptional regulator